MKPKRRRMVELWLCGGLLCAGALGLIVKRAWADDPPQPVLRMTQVDSNRFQITITNAVSYANYEIYRRPKLADPNFSWTAPITGALGQANFTVINTNFVNLYEFFRAGVGSDWDLDGVLNWRDAQPSSTNAGLLNITIEFPAGNGTVP